MSESTGKAVFLSYADEDAVAAQRIAEALRAGGVEGWFDQSELRGGDAWDAKIREQVETCALFVPIISAHTQARREGYFRLEWNLADDRTHLMAGGTPFLLPVVIDETQERGALVPKSFLGVQWARITDVETPSIFCTQVKSLQDGEVIPRSMAPPSQANSSVGAAAPARRLLTPWMVAGIVGVATCCVAVLWQPWSKKGNPPATTPSVPASAPVSAARQLVAKAWEEVHSTPEPYRANLNRRRVHSPWLATFFPAIPRARSAQRSLGHDAPRLASGWPSEGRVFTLAADFCKRAAELDATDPEVWAAWSQIDTWSVALLEASTERRDAARTKAAQALALSPKSYEARLAQACYLVRGEGFHAVSVFSADAEPLLRELLQERPDEPRALLALGHFLRNRKRVDESAQIFDHLALSPAIGSPQPITQRLFSITAPSVGPKPWNPLRSPSPHAHFMLTWGC